MFNDWNDDAGRSKSNAIKDNGNEVDDDDNYWHLSVRKTHHNIFNEDKQAKSPPQQQQQQQRKSSLNSNDNNASKEEEKIMFRSSNDTQKSPKSVFYVNSDSNTSSKSALATEAKVVSTTRQSEPLYKDNLKEQRLKTEISFKDAELLYLKEKRDEAPDIQETIDRILSDKPFWFDLYKTKLQKVTLLDTAIKSQDGNAILAVVLFLKRTLSNDVFLNVISSKTEALNHYTYYLEQMKDFKLLNEMYRQLGKNSDAAFNAYRPILSSSLAETSDLNTKLKVLNSIKENYTNDISNIASKHMQLLEFEKKFDKSSNSNTILDAISLLNRKNNDPVNNVKISFDSVHEAITYCLKNYQKLPKSDQFVPENMKKDFGLTNKQYSFIFIKAMAECSFWTEIDRFTMPSSQFSNLGFNPRRTSDIPWETIVNIIQMTKGPEEEMKKYLRLVENTELRQSLAIKYKLHDVVIEVCKQLKDKQSLLHYLTKIQVNSNEFIEVNKALKDPSIKWKT